jgi:branched-chain amino acid transport system ATP-binding protein
MSLLELSSLSAGYGTLGVLHGVDLRVEEGEVVALLGTNGAGKTTLLRTVAGLHAPSGGMITYAGRPLAGLPAHEVSAAGLALVPEGRQLFPEHTVLENLELGAFRRLAAGDRAGFSRDLHHVYDLFPRLRERAGQQAGLLSGGEQQMVAIARAIVGRPRLLLLDEPSLGLAPIIVDAIFAIFRRLRDDGTTILLVEQMARKAIDLCDRAYVLAGGSVLVHGPRETMRSDPRVVEAYLGRTVATAPVVAGAG